MPSDTSGSPGTRDRVAVVVNGNAKRVNNDLVSMLDQIVASGDLFVSRDLDEGHEIARTIVEKGYPTVLTGGGDGTFVQVVTWIRAEAERTGQPEPRFGMLRLGTGNALAWVLGAQNPKGRGVATDLARLRREAGSRPLRLLDVEGLLTPFAGLGVDAVALQHYNDMKDQMSKIPVARRFASGGLAYLASVTTRSIPEYLVRSHPKVRLVNHGAPALRLGVDGRPLGREIRAGETMYEGPSQMVAMSTIPYWGFGARIFPYANERDGLFSLRVVDIGPVDVVLNIRSIWRGTYRSDRVHDFLVQSVRVEYERPMPLQIGGDPLGAKKVTHASIAERPIRVVDYYSPPELS
ncbi:MAG: diacylglycerol kinase family protein [Myxococcota bacterium]